MDKKIILLNSILRPFCINEELNCIGERKYNFRQGRQSTLAAFATEEKKHIKK